MAKIYLKSAIVVEILTIEIGTKMSTISPRVFGSETFKKIFLIQIFHRKIQWVFYRYVRLRIIDNHLVANSCEFVDVPMTTLLF